MNMKAKQYLPWIISIICIFIALKTTVTINIGTDGTDPVTYSWPETEFLAEDLEYKGQGDITQVDLEDVYASVNGSRSKGTVRVLNITIEGIDPTELENYVSGLKNAGFQYKGYTKDDNEEDLSKELGEYGSYSWHGSDGRISLVLNLSYRYWQYTGSDGKDHGEDRYILYYTAIDDDMWKTDYTDARDSHLNAPWAFIREG